MNVHKNARSCPASRALLVRRVDAGRPVWEAASEIGLTARRAREWIRRARNDEPLTDRSSRPRRSRTIEASSRDSIVQLRRQRCTFREIARRVGVSLSSVARICGREGLNRLCALDPAPARHRYQRDCPGELLHIDVKKLGRFERVGHRITGNKTGQSRGLGWDHVHVAIDDASRVMYSEILNDDYSDNSIAFLNRAVAWFAQHGVTVTALMTDNAPAYISQRYAVACRQLAIRHIRIRPYTPRTNGKAERVIQTLLREWAYRFSYQNSEHRHRWLNHYLHFYNYHRAHSALAYNPPISRLAWNNVLRRDS